MLRIDETSKTLVAPPAGGLVTEVSPDRDELLALVCSSWEAFAGELGQPSLRFVVQGQAPGLEVLAFDEQAGRAVVVGVSSEVGDAQLSGALAGAASVAAKDAAAARGRPRVADRRRARRLAADRAARLGVRRQDARHRRLAHPPPRARDLVLRAVGLPLRQRAAALDPPRVPGARRRRTRIPPPRSSACWPAWPPTATTSPTATPPAAARPLSTTRAARGAVRDDAARCCFAPCAGGSPACWWPGRSSACSGSTWAGRSCRCSRSRRGWRRSRWSARVAAALFGRKLFALLVARLRAAADRRAGAAGGAEPGAGRRQGRAAAGAGGERRRQRSRGARRSSRSRGGCGSTCWPSRS